MKNIKLSYLYRDAGNYKNFGEVIFTNTTGIRLVEIEATILSCLIEESWFVADKWGLPDLHFKEFDWDSDLDHDWHELEGIEETEEIATKEDVTTFLKLIKTIKL